MRHRSRMETGLNHQNKKKKRAAIVGNGSNFVQTINESHTIDHHTSGHTFDVDETNNSINDRIQETSVVIMM
ncbi:hypothetical protein RDWZM_007495 [Blomia tropicalis]|uniref:Uncharacterized protein n=1 Tax=Blomia tropicalis TaxID=40697 RepID=A0A9Q0RI22_BLOTA|nr:hypothetical protein RDWZM_007495 [Blomia tropicalis]